MSDIKGLDKDSPLSPLTKHSDNKRKYTNDNTDTNDNCKNENNRENIYNNEIIIIIMVKMMMKIV